MIKINNLSKEFRIGTEVVMALNGINLEIQEGEFVVIIGPSGSGKTTLLNIIGALDKPTQGDVIIDNFNLNQFSIEQQAKFRCEQLGFVFQFFYLQNYLSALENIALPAMFKGVVLEQRQKQAMNLAKTVGLEQRIKHKPEELSGGERQRVAIARSLMNSPKILLADEPTGNLDRANSDAIIQLLKQLNKEKNMTVILVTHDEKIQSAASRIIKMDKGEIIL